MEVKGCGQGHKDNDLGAIYKGFISCVCMQNMQFLSHIVQNLCPRFMFLQQTDKQKQLAAAAYLHRYVGLNTLYSYYQGICFYEHEEIFDTYSSYIFEYSIAKTWQF